MATTLLTTGLLCVIAAIVGGGIEALGGKVPVIQSPKRQAALGGFGTILLFGAWLSSSSSAPLNKKLAPAAQSVVPANNSVPLGSATNSGSTPPTSPPTQAAVNPPSNNNSVPNGNATNAGPNSAPNPPKEPDPPKADPIYALWLGTWDDDETTDWSSIEIYKDKSTDKLVAELDAASRNSDGVACNVSYRLTFKEPYHSEGLNFEGDLTDADSSCQYSNPAQITGALMAANKGGTDALQLTVAYNMNVHTERLFTKSHGPCKLASGGVLGQCIPDPSAAYHH